MRKRIVILNALLLIMLLNANAKTNKYNTQLPKKENKHEIKGLASYYGGEYMNGRLTASGEIFHDSKMTCAHKTLPFGTKIKVINKANGKSVVVKVTDRGPFVKNRIVDLSLAAAKKIEIVKQGVADVEVKIL